MYVVLYFYCSSLRLGKVTRRAHLLNQSKMPTLLESYNGALSLIQLNYFALAIAIFITCGSAFVCVHCSLVNSVLNFTVFCLRILITLPQAVEEYLSARNEVDYNHYILDIRPEYGVDINQIISDILHALNQGSSDYCVPEKLTKYRSAPRKFDVKGWRRKLNERWKKKMKFMRAIILGIKYKWNDIEYEAFSERESMRSSRYSNESRMEKFVLGPEPPERDEDDDLDRTIVYPDHLHKFSCFILEAGKGSSTPDWE